MAVEKLSQIASGGAFVATTDNIVTVRNGNTDVLTTITNPAANVESVTGLNTNNADPTNPIVQISVDGSTITGAGTPGSPLVSHASGSIPQAAFNYIG